MFIISELGAMVKIIVSIIGYLLFLPVSLVDKLILSKIFEGELHSVSVSFFIVLFLLFLFLGITMKTIGIILKLCLFLPIIYHLSNVLVGLFLVSILVYLLKKSKKIVGRYEFDSKDHRKQY